MGSPALASAHPLSRRTLLLTALAVTLFYALLWSPWWYPLSDSALYLNMARALAQGKGFESMRQMHRDVRPLTPLLLFGIMRLGGGIGAMHAVMIGLTLLSHALAFLTLRRWFNERVALLAVLATAGSWWVYANAFTIMTEPPFLVMFWAAMLALSRVPRETRRAQWLLVIASALFMAGAWENRVAAVLLLPGIVFGLSMSNRDVCWRVRSGWIAVFVIVFGLLIWDYRRPAPGAQAAAAHEETYHVNVLVGIKDPWVQLPVSAGRWVIEGLAMPAAAPFEMSSRAVLIVAGAAVVAFFAVACLGWCTLWRGRHWYAVGMAVYFLPYVILWGARIKPRYMTPIAPVLFIQLWAGSLMVLRRRIAAETVGALLCASLIVLNLVPYGIELYVRHGTAMNFYDIARQGAFAELVDIGAYVEKHAAPGETIAVNWPPPSSRPPDANFAPDRRIVQFLTDRAVEFAKPTSDGSTVMGSEDREHLQAFLQQVPGDWAIVYYSGRKWPGYHLPLQTHPAEGVRWWQLFHRDPTTRRFEAVAVPRQLNAVRGIPGWSR